MSFASAALSKRLLDLTNWRDTDFCWDDVELPFYVEKGSQLDGGFPAYDLGYLIEKALETGHIHIKIRHGKKGFIVTAPPCYHIEAESPADAVAQLLINSAQRNFVLNKPEKIGARGARKKV